MEEKWKKILEFENYSASTLGNIRRDVSGRMLAFSQNQYGVVCVGLMRGPKQYNRSVPLLVAKAFVPRPFGPFDTPINLNGDRFDNRVENLIWRPRWFAIMYNRQFHVLYEYPINRPIRETKTGEVFATSMECAQRYGLLERDLVLSILNYTCVWPTYQRFEIVE